MGWFNNDYDRDHDRVGAFGRRHGGASDWNWGGGRHHAEQPAERGRWGLAYGRQRYGGEYASGAGGYSTWRQPDTAFGFNRYGYDYNYRARPEESPTYGRGGDQAVQRWARRYGYDMGYQIDPRTGQGGTSRGYESGGGGYSPGGRSYSSRGRDDTFGGQGSFSRGRGEAFGGRGESFGGPGYSRQNRYGRELRW